MAQKPGSLPIGGCCDTLALPLEEQDVETWAALCHALADKTRVQLLAVLCRYAGEVCVCHLVAAFPLSQPTISHHLGVLKSAGLVRCKKRGPWAYYYPNWEAINRLRQFIERIQAQEVRP
ncbi:MAG: helix-turn-helix transcriptional regulator [Chloroflexi bacterium]|nr:helix-turn-helix transcriptional regulator [Chloroflexota bacterium]